MEGDEPNLNVLILGGHRIPPELLIHIFQFLKCRDLISKCAYVCHSWRDAVWTVDLWIKKCKRKQVTLPQKLKQVYPDWRVYAKICSKNPFGRNLIKNPCGMPGENPLRYWDVIRNGGDGWVVESPPIGADAIEELDGIRMSGSCFATSFSACRKYQIVDLYQEGLSPNLIDDLQPNINISEWYAARFDCGALYKLRVSLLDENKTVLEDGEFTHSWEERQWLGREWHKVETTFQNYGPGLRYVMFTHEGRDTMFWAGHYGSKMTGASVRASLH